MKNNRRILTAAVMLILGQAWHSATAKLPDFEHYRVILDRRPFGEIAPPPEASESIISIDSFAKDLELRAIIDEGGSIRVGMRNKNDDRHFFISMGETVDGIQLVAADYDAEEVVLRKNDETIVFKLRPDQPGSGTAIAGTSAARPSPFQPASPSASGASAPRRPFFAELRKQRSRTGTSTNEQPEGFAGFFRPQPQPKEGDAPAQPSPFGPFTPVTGANATNVPIPFGMPTQSPAGEGAGMPFMPFNPNPPGFQTEGRGETIENFFFQPSADDSMQFQPVDDYSPFQIIQDQ